MGTFKYQWMSTDGKNVGKLSLHLNSGSSYFFLSISLRIVVESPSANCPPKNETLFKRNPTNIWHNFFSSLWRHSFISKSRECLYFYWTATCVSVASCSYFFQAVQVGCAITPSYSTRIIACMIVDSGKKDICSCAKKKTTNKEEEEKIWRERKYDSNNTSMYVIQHAVGMEMKKKDGKHRMQNVHTERKAI